MVGRGIAKQLVGTMVAVFGGWFAALLFCGALYVFGPSHQREPVDAGVLFGGTIIMSWFMAWFIVPAWEVILIPLYLFVPPRSILWRWPGCTAFGGSPRDSFPCALLSRLTCLVM